MVEVIVVGAKDDDNFHGMVSLFLHSNLPYNGKFTAQIFCDKLTDIWYVCDALLNFYKHGEFSTF